MIRILRSIFRKPLRKVYKVDRNTPREVASEIKKALSAKVFDFCKTEKSIADISREYDLAYDYTREIVRDLEDRGKVKIRMRKENGHKHKCVTQQ